MKMTFLLFCVVILNDTRFFSTSFAVHCCLVWWVGVPQSFLRSIMNVIATIVNHSNLVDVLEVQSTEKSAREREETVNISSTFIIGPFHTISLLIM